MDKIYCISGLGTDNRILGNLKIKNHELIYIPWVPYESKDDMKSYAMKMARQVKEKNPLLLGYSFGGMLAAEIGKQVATRRIFLVSSAKTRAELGYRGNFLKWLALKEIIPSFVFTTPDFFQLHFLGAKTGQEKKLLCQLIRETNPAFVRGCINIMLGWENESYPPNVTHIHGTDDKVIRPANVHPDYWIKGGSHIMIYNRADEVNKIIDDCLSA